MRPTRLVIAAVLALAGLVWLGQGIGLIDGSFMTGSPVWAVIGAGMLVGAVAMVIAERRRT